MNVYIDIDGVLLTKNNKIPKGGQDLISFLTKNFNCFWLTTHCRHGENKALEYLKAFYTDTEIDLLKNVKPTNWIDLKTEGINLNSNFIWLEDYPFESEKMVLRKSKKLNSLILVDLKKKDELKSIIQKIKFISKNEKLSL